MAHASAETRWVKRAFAAMVVVFFVNAARFYASTFPSFIHSDVAVTVLVGAKVLSSKLPIVPDFYYANGDIWVFGPHWWAAIVIPLLGVTPESVLAVTVLGLAIEIAALVWAFRRLGAPLWVGAFASLVTLFPWSKTHLLFVYVELAYGFNATIYLVMFASVAWLFGSSANLSSARRMVYELGTGFFLFLIALQNPLRAAVFGLVPVLAACAWPWRGCSIRSRVRAALVPSAALLCAFFVYRFALKRLLTFSPYGGGQYVFKDARGILTNLGLVLRGLMALSCARDDLAASAILGLVLVVGALVAVIATLRSRALEPLRFVAVAAVAQLGIILVLISGGNLIGDESSARYVLPGLLSTLGLGVVASARALSPPRLGAAWLCLFPIVGAIATSRRFVGAREVFSQADPIEQVELAQALVHRGLRHGFASFWNANVVTVLSHGATKTCGVTFGAGLVPLKWVVDTACFDPAVLPSQIYVVARADEHDAAAVATEASLGPPTDRFAVGTRYEVTVFRTKDRDLSWLALPLSPSSN